MFKKSFLTASLIGLGLSVVTAQASEPYPYIAGSLGSATHKLGSVNADGYTLSIGDRNASAYKLLLGVQANDYIAAEVQYTNLGEASKTYRGSLYHAKLEADTYGIGFNVVGTLPIQDLTLFAKLGTHRMSTDFSGSASVPGFYETVSATQRNWATMVGVGAAYAVTPHIELTLEYESFYDVADVYDAHLLSGGVRYNF